MGHITMSNWNMYYTGTLEEVSIANSQISTNCGLPFGETTTWAIPVQAYEQDFWFIPMPSPTGWTREDGTHFTQSEMIIGVISVEEEEGQSNWWPPSPFPPN